MRVWTDQWPSWSCWVPALSDNGWYTPQDKNLITGRSGEPLRQPLISYSKTLQSIGPKNSWKSCWRFNVFMWVFVPKCKAFKVLHFTTYALKFWIDLQFSVMRQVCQSNRTSTEGQQIYGCANNVLNNIFCMPKLSTYLFLLPNSSHVRNILLVW